MKKTLIERITRKQARELLGRYENGLNGYNVPADDSGARHDEGVRRATEFLREQLDDASLRERDVDMLICAIS